jgi:hypothetical protein
MADRRLGMGHVSDAALQRLAASLPEADLPVMVVSALVCEALGFEVVGPLPADCEAWLVSGGQRVARLTLP